MSFYLIFIIKGEGRKLGLLCLTGLIFSAILSEVILKNIFSKLRPYDTLYDVNLLVPKEKSFSFPSGHATSSLTSAIILGSKNKRKLLLFLILAIFISFSRIYCGVHYPSDVLFGALIGLFLGSIIIFLYHKKIGGDKK
jgi:undecaprenyl-diphosphatase